MIKTVTKVTNAISNFNTKLQNAPTELPKQTLNVVKNTLSKLRTPTANPNVKPAVKTSESSRQLATQAISNVSNNLNVVTSGPIDSRRLVSVDSSLKTISNHLKDFKKLLFDKQDTSIKRASEATPQPIVVNVTQPTQKQDKKSLLDMLLAGLAGLFGLTASGLMSLLGNVLDFAKSPLDFIMKIVTGGTRFISWIWDQLKNALGFGLDSLKKVGLWGLGAMKWLGGSLAELTGKIWNSIKSLIPGLNAPKTAPKTNVKSAKQPKPTKVTANADSSKSSKANVKSAKAEATKASEKPKKPTLRERFRSFSDNIKNKITTVYSKSKEKLGELSKYASDKWNKLSSWAKNVWTSSVNYVKSQANNIVSVWSKYYETTKRAVKNCSTYLLNKLSKLIEPVFNRVTGSGKLGKVLTKCFSNWPVVSERLSKVMGKSASKLIPGVGFGIGVYMAWDYFSEGRWGFGIAAAVSALISLIPGIGGIVGCLMDLGIGLADILTSENDIKKLDDEQAQAIDRSNKLMTEGVTGDFSSLDTKTVSTANAESSEASTKPKTTVSTANAVASVTPTAITTGASETTVSTANATKSVISAKTDSNKESSKVDNNSKDGLIGGAPGPDASRSDVSKAAKAGVSVASAAAVASVESAKAVASGAPKDENKDRSYNRKRNRDTWQSANMKVLKTAAYPTDHNVVTSDYGPRNVPGGSKFHRGIDIRARDKEPVYAMFGGEVIGTSGRYGAVSIKQPDGKIARYLHLRNYNVVGKGDTVEAGEKIGEAGGRGPNGPLQYAPHLHLDFADRFGTKKDPVYYIKSAGLDFKLKDAKDGFDSYGGDYSAYAAVEQNYDNKVTKQTTTPISATETAKSTKSTANAESTKTPEGVVRVSNSAGLIAADLDTEAPKVVNKPKSSETAANAASTVKPTTMSSNQTPIVSGITTGASEIAVSAANAVNTVSSETSVDNKTTINKESSKVDNNSKDGLIGGAPGPDASKTEVEKASNVGITVTPNAETPKTTVKSAYAVDSETSKVTKPKPAAKTEAPKPTTTTKYVSNPNKINVRYTKSLKDIFGDEENSAYAEDSKSYAVASKTPLESKPMRRQNPKIKDIIQRPQETSINNTNTNIMNAQEPSENKDLFDAFVLS